MANITLNLFSDVNCTIECPTLQDFPSEYALWILGVAAALFSYTVIFYALIFVFSMAFLCQSSISGLHSFKVTMSLLALHLGCIFDRPVGWLRNAAPFFERWAHMYIGSSCEGPAAVGLFDALPLLHSHAHVSPSCHVRLFQLR